MRLRLLRFSAARERENGSAGGWPEAVFAAGLFDFPYGRAVVGGDLGVWGMLGCGGRERWRG